MTEGGGAPSALRLAKVGSSLAKTKKMTAMTTSAAAQICATASQPQATMTKGARNFVTAAPTLPMPQMPSAVPWLSFGNQCET